MTHFEQVPDSDQFRMDTMMPIDTAHTMKSMRDVEYATFTEAIRQAVSAHKWYTDCRAAGNVILERTAERIDPMLIPEVDITDDRVAQFSVVVNPSVKEYLEPISDKDDPLDLLGFWKQATSLMGYLKEIQILNREVLMVEPTMRTRIVKFDSFFGKNAQTAD